MRFLLLSVRLQWESPISLHSCSFSRKVGTVIFFIIQHMLYKHFLSYFLPYTLVWWMAYLMYFDQSQNLKCIWILLNYIFYFVGLRCWKNWRVETITPREGKALPQIGVFRASMDAWKPCSSPRTESPRLNLIRRAQRRCLCRPGMHPPRRGAAAAIPAGDACSSFCSLSVSRSP